MEVSLPLLRAMFPKVPLIGKTALYHTLGLSESSQEWDLRTALVVNMIRSFVVNSPPSSISKTQRLSLRDPGIKGRIWVSKVTIPKPDEDDVRQAVFKTIEGLKDPGDAPGGYKEPELAPVEAEWTGYRAGAKPDSPEEDISEEEKYKEMMREVSSPATVLYFHGGAYYLMDPSSHRPTTKQLAKLTNGRCLSVRYRLAPQNPFPSALIDALVSYLSLLYPPPGSFHAAVDPQHIVFSGDSAGGNLCMVLVQTILELRRQGPGTILWHGQVRDLPLPAGLALCSPWVDVTHSSPSCESNAAYDYLPPQSARAQYPACALWPAVPPRTHLYADDALLAHPLVSPLAAASWAGSCPWFVGTGTELLTDEDRCVAARAAGQGVPVVFEEYVAMPHCFAMILKTLPASTRYFAGWAGFIRDVVENPAGVKTKGVLIRPKTLKEEPLEVTTLVPWTHDEVCSRLRERVHTLSHGGSDPMSKL
jgi:acetyl esterase/lipase